jgi:hypothetical protein
MLAATSNLWLSNNQWSSSLATTIAVVLLLNNLQVLFVQAGLPCEKTAHCEAILRPGSECVDGSCTNPYHKGGCLAQVLPDWHKIRVCHSEDPPEAEVLGYCIPPDPDLNYLEIRVAAQNRESAFFQVWIMQIVLSEILGIPVTLESGTAQDQDDFYHPASPLSYGVAYPYDGVRLANDVLDCRLVNKDPDHYQACAHVIPEIWYGQEEHTRALFHDGVIERPDTMGALGYAGEYIPIFTAAADPTLVTYLGLAGEQHRHKLAKTFLRPTTWKDYCEDVSTTNCTVADDYSSSYPPKREEGRYHMEEFYQGYFRATEKNDCKKYPTNCTGHIVVSRIQPSF